MIERTKEILANLIAFPSVSSDSNLPIIDYCEALLVAAGARTERQYDLTGEKANLWASIGPEGDGGLILSGHTDVVPVEGQPWTTAPFQMVELDGRLYGRGACDMKGFVACVLAMLPRFAEASIPIHVALTYDEEVSCLGAVDLAQHLLRRGIRPAMALIGEPTEMTVVDGHKGCFEYSVRLTGKEGHGSRPELGVNAGVYAARYVQKLMELANELAAKPRPDTGFVPPWTTVNVGRILAGSATNVIPGEARIDWEMRPIVEADARGLLDELHRFAREEIEPEMKAMDPNSGIDFVTIGEFPAFLPSNPNPARDLLLSLTGANSAGLVSYCTEAGAFSDIGVSAVICGPGSILQAHKPDEYIAVAQLQACLDLLGRLARRLS
jgi:acetylornithine deacetylase